MQVIKPGEGFDKFLIGDTLYFVLKEIRKVQKTNSGKKYRIIYDNVLHNKYLNIENNSLEDIFELNDKFCSIEIDNQIRLSFNRNQILFLIEIFINNTLANEEIVYQNKTISNDVTFNQIYNNIFGPTYATANDNPITNTELAENFYILKYPGISFSFKTQEKSIENLLKNDSLICNTISIFKNSTKTSLNYNPVLESKSSIDHVQIDIIKGVSDFKFYNDPETSIPIVINHTTIQDMIMKFGPPNEKFYKNENSIYNNTNNDLLFYNYFDLGFDVCFFNAKVKKLIFHSNLPNSINFGKYNKINWSITGLEEDGEPSLKKHVDEIDGSILVNKLIDSNNDNIEFINDLNANETTLPNTYGEYGTFGITYLYGKKGVVYEALKENNFISSITIY